MFRSSGGRRRDGNGLSRKTRFPRAAVPLAIAERILLATGLVLLGLWSAAGLRAGIFQLREARRFLAPHSGKPAHTAASRQARPGEALGLLRIPRLDVSAVIAEGSDRATLEEAVGHISGTAWPGAPGNACLAAHRDGLFRPLREIQKDDTVQVVTLEGEFDYLVDSTLVVSPDSTAVLAASGGTTLTLITCYPFHYIGSAPRRFVVRATRAGGPSSAARAD